MLKVPTRLVIALLLFGVSFFNNANSDDNEVDHQNTLSRHDKSVIIENLIITLETRYLTPEKSQQILYELKVKDSVKGYPSRYEVERFVSDMNRRLRKATRDTQITVRYDKVNDENNTENDNAGINVELADNGLGYLAFQGSRLGISDNRIFANINSSLAGTKALIIDLRAADQVELEVICQLLGYFIAPNEVVGELETNHNVEPIIVKASAAKLMFDQTPIYILTSAFVEGAWELFIQTLQESKGAVVIGQETMGVAQLLKTESLSENVLITYPFANIFTKMTNPSWQGVGITPDHYADNEEGLAKAVTLALSSISSMEFKEQ